MDVREALALLRETPRAMWRAPRRWSARGWLAAVALLAATVSAQLAKTWIDAHTPRLDVTMPIVWAADALGGGVAVAGFGVALFVLGWAARRAAWVDGAAVLAAGGLPCFVLTRLGQFVLAEARPRDGGAMHFFALDGHGVSGHASAAALLFFPCVVVASRSASAPARTARGVALAAWIALVAWTRTALGMHFAWNVLLGLALGLFCGHTATRVWRERRARG